MVEEHGEESLLYNNLREKEHDLLSQAQEKFGSLSRAVGKAGYDYQEIGGRKPDGYWSKERIIKNLKELKEKHGLFFLAPKYLQKNHSSLLRTAHEKFGSYGKAVEEAGYSYGEILGQKPDGWWNEERIVERLKEIAREYGEEFLSSGKLRKKDHSLFSAARDMFGSLRKAVEEAGFDYDKVISRNPPGYWTEEKVKGELNKLAKRKGKKYLSDRNLKQNEISLWNAARRVFGALSKAIEGAGFDYDKIRRRRLSGYWSEERIVRRLKEIAEEHGEEYLADSRLRWIEAGLHSAARKKFHSLKNAIEKAGFDYNEIKSSGALKSDIWRYWEKVCEEIISLIHGEKDIKIRKKVKEDLVIPDFRIIDKNDVIIDAKLHPWERSLPEDIEKYSKYCDRLEFWCLEGERDLVPGDVEIVSSEELLERLEENGLGKEEIEEFEKKMELIKRGINPYEEAQEEISEFGREKEGK